MMGSHGLRGRHERPLKGSGPASGINIHGFRGEAKGLGTPVSRLKIPGKGKNPPNPGGPAELS